MNTAITDFYFKLRGGNGVTLTSDEAERLYSVLLQQQESFAAKVAEVERLNTAGRALADDIISRIEPDSDGFQPYDGNLEIWTEFCDAMEAARA